MSGAPSFLNLGSRAQYSQAPSTVTLWENYAVAAIQRTTPSQLWWAHVHVSHARTLRCVPVSCPCAALRAVNLGGTAITDTTLGILGPLCFLRHLGLEGCGLLSPAASAGVVAASAPALRSLMLSGSGGLHHDVVSAGSRTHCLYLATCSRSCDPTACGKSAPSDKLKHLLNLNLNVL